MSTNYIFLGLCFAISSASLASSTNIEGNRLSNVETKSPDDLSGLQSNALNEGTCKELTDQLESTFETMEICKRNDNRPTLCKVQAQKVQFLVYDRITGADPIKFSSFIDLSTSEAEYTYSNAEMAAALETSTETTVGFASYQLSNVTLDAFDFKLSDDSLSARALQYDALKLNEGDWLEMGNQDVNIRSKALVCDILAGVASISLAAQVDADIVQLSKATFIDELWAAYVELSKLNRHPSWSDRDYAIIIGHRLSLALPEVSNSQMLNVASHLINEDFSLRKWQSKQELSANIELKTTYSTEIPLDLEIK